MASRDIYYIPHGSKWPIVGTLSLFITFLGGAMMFNNAPGSKYVLIVGLAALVYMFAGWFADVIGESLAGKYNKQVDGMVYRVRGNVLCCIFWGTLLCENVFSSLARR